MANLFSPRLTLFVVVLLLASCSDKFKPTGPAPIEFQGNATNGYSVTLDWSRASIISLLDETRRVADPDVTQSRISRLVVNGAEPKNPDDWRVIASMSSRGMLKDLTFSDVLAIPDSLFCDNKSLFILRSISAPKALRVGKSAFNGCSYLSNASFAQATKIERRAFYSCVSLAQLDLPNAEHIEAEAYLWNRSLRTFDLPKVKTIGLLAFSNCEKIESISLPKVDSIASGAFSSASSLTTLSLPKVRYLNGFRGCYNISSVDCPMAEIIGESAFSGCRFTHVSFPKVIEVQQSAFYGCSGLTSIEFPLLRRVGKEAFYSININNLYLPSATDIEDSAFGGNANLSYVDLPVVRNIGINSFEFSYCKAVKLGSVLNSFVGKPYISSYPNTELYLCPEELATAQGNKWRGYEWKSIGEYVAHEK